MVSTVTTTPLPSTTGAFPVRLSINQEYCRKNELEERMLLNLSKKRWTDGLSILDFEKHAVTNEKFVSELKDLSEKYIKVCARVCDIVLAVECVRCRPLPRNKIHLMRSVLSPMLVVWM